MNLLKFNFEVIEKQMMKDVMGIIQCVLEKVNVLLQDKCLFVMIMLFGKEFGDDVVKLVNNLLELQCQLKLIVGNDVFGFMQKEFDINKDLFFVQWLLVKIGVQNIFSSLGEMLCQLLMDILYMVKSVMGVLCCWVEVNLELMGILMKVVVIVVVVIVGFGILVVVLVVVLGLLVVICLGFFVLGIKMLFFVMVVVI